VKDINGDAKFYNPDRESLNTNLAFDFGRVGDVFLIQKTMDIYYGLLWSFLATFLDNSAFENDSSD
jgi:hypothetical protein